MSDTSYKQEGKKSLKQNSVYLQIHMSSVTNCLTAGAQHTHFCKSREHQHLCADSSSFVVRGFNIWGSPADLGVS